MIPVLIIGKSGSGKSASMRNLPTDGTIVINVLGKPLPFRNTLKTVHCTDSGKIVAAINKGGYERYVIDDMGYLMTGQFMTALASRGKGQDTFQLYTDIGLNMWYLIKALLDNPFQSRVYMMMHEETDDYGNVKPKAFGKLVEQKVCIEGMVTICLRAVVSSDNRHVFLTNSNGLDVAKSPMGMFENHEIDNDLNAVDAAIKDYYNIGGMNNETH